MSEFRGFEVPLLSPDTVRSRSVADLRDAVQRHTVVHDVEARGGRPDGLVSFATVGALSLVYVRYGARVAVDAFPTRNRFTLTVPLGPMRVCPGGGGQPAVTFRSGFVLFQERHTVMVPDPSAGALVVSTALSRLEEHLSTLTGRAAVRGVRFLPPDEGVAAGPPRLLESSWRMVCHTLSGVPAGGLGGLVERQLEDILLSGILLGLPHTLSSDLADDAESRPAPDVVERAREWLEEHYEEPVTVHDLAGAMNLSVRQLQHLFRERYGTAPIEALRDIRFRQARRLLTLPSSSGSVPTVAAVAHRCGFTHLSRFSVSYRQRFGESPSETVRRARLAAVPR